MKPVGFIRFGLLACASTALAGAMPGHLYASPLVERCNLAAGARPAYDGSDDAVKRGLKDQGKKQYDAAIDEFTKAIHLRPRNIQAYLGRAGVYLERQDYRSAIADYDFLIDQYGVADAYYGRGEAYRQQNAYDPALADFAAAVEICKRPAGSLPELNGGRKLTPGDFQAYQQWQRAVDIRDSEEKHKKNTAALAHAAMGRVYLDLKQFEKAASSFSSAVYDNAKFAAGYAGLGSANYALKKYNEAVFDFNFAILMQPDTASLYHDRGIAYLDVGNSDKAIQDFEKCLKLDPTSEDAANTRALITAAKKPTVPSTAAVAGLPADTKAAHIPDKAQTAYARGDAFREQKEYTKAIEAYTDAIRLLPNYAIAYKARAEAYRALKQPGKAVADYDAAIRLYPEISGAESGREQALNEQKQQVEAMNQQNEAIRRNPRDYDAYIARGTAYLEQDENEKAISDLTTALEIKPNDVAARSYRAAAYVAAKQYDRALTDLQSLKEALKGDPDALKSLQDVIDETKQEAAKAASQPAH